MEWSVRGYYPYEWHLGRTVESGIMLQGEVPPVPATVPGSVQHALRKAGVIPNWEIGLNARECEWVENRHWVYETTIPDEWVPANGSCRLRFNGLDYNGSIWLNGREIHRFNNSHLPHIVDVTGALEGGDQLSVVFECPPRWLGQFGYTSHMRDWKARYNYYWDWTARLVQIGFSNNAYLEVFDEGEIVDVYPRSTVDIEASTATLRVNGAITAPQTAKVTISLEDGNGSIVQSGSCPVAEFTGGGITLNNMPVDLWWPGELGDQPLYTLKTTLLSGSGDVLDTLEQTIGFRSVEWLPAEGAPAAADPWICSVNGTPLFLQGVNWTPIRPNYADLTERDYEKRIRLYRDLGINLLRIWGGGFLEKPWLYELCNRYGIMVWQEFPLSSSGVENYPPDDDQSIEVLSEIARSYIHRRRHHPSLIIWCGGNELSGNKTRPPVPVDHTHPLIARFAEIVKEMDPDKRFLTSTPSGPSFGARAEDYGKGIHWAVNGPWKAVGRLDESWQRYWLTDDSLMRSETGAPGPSPLELTERLAGDCDVFPCSIENPLWRRSSWWIEWDQFIDEHGREPKDAAEYIIWGQKRQSDVLSFAASCCKKRFPRCGGIILWMGHDSFPCTANTAIVDFEGNPKPAALALKKVFRGE